MFPVWQFSCRDSTECCPGIVSIYFLNPLLTVAVAQWLPVRKSISCSTFTEFLYSKTWLIRNSVIQNFTIIWILVWIYVPRRKFQKRWIEVSVYWTSNLSLHYTTWNGNLWQWWHDRRLHIVPTGAILILPTNCSLIKKIFWIIEVLQNSRLFFGPLNSKLTGFYCT
jgi:hypothetical protein